MKQQGGSAFPRAGYFYNHQIQSVPVEGMSLRDWFAGMMLSQIQRSWNAEKTAFVAYAMADAMIAERSK